ncbi:hypothetical protein [Sinorhizobium sp. GL28]|uniref:hypothetical protein n=1 Tax=Sinorhizobium sp. GL28 TaxID=1358418 RepID=UPI00071E1523|nr:hypothetical protein [Sinorhizobium sp. GL28]KSV87552.1 hypothetical protein N184_30830 [Sinorhizobium sp. GL28]
MATEGDEYMIVEPGLDAHYRFTRQNDSGWMVPRELETDEKRVVSYSYEQFARMRGHSSARRIMRNDVASKGETRSFPDSSANSEDDLEVGHA